MALLGMLKKQQRIQIFAADINPFSLFLAKEDYRLVDDGDIYGELGTWSSSLSLKNKNKFDLWILMGNPSLISYLRLGQPKEFLSLKSANVDMRFLHYDKLSGAE